MSVESSEQALSAETSEDQDNTAEAVTTQTGTAVSRLEEEGDVAADYL